MYSDSELDAAVRAGILPPATAQAFRDFVARSHAAPGADEEHFRLLTGFNDIFVAIAVVLTLTAVGMLLRGISPSLAACGVAATAWALAEYFTRRRRMALPSILLLLAFAGAVSAAPLIATAPALGIHTPPYGRGTDTAWRLAAGTTCMALAAALHWWRFRVPITVAAAALAATGLAASLLRALLPDQPGMLRVPTLAAGFVVFAAAMWWDASDRERTTRRADIAFWLHLAAAPLIVHPVFTLLGLMGTAAPAPGAAVLAIALYLLLAVVALAVDRRALLVSALVYVLVAVNALMHASGAIGQGLAATLLVIGGLLLALSALWTAARRVVLTPLPETWRGRLPPVPAAG